MTAKDALPSPPGVDGSRGELRLDSGLLPRCGIWAVLNVTPDSFSDGGRFLDPQVAVAQGWRLAREGASVIDVGGASSRPPGATYGAGAAWVSIEEEIARVVPVIAALAHDELTVSIDTCRGRVAQAALAAGATIVNDVSMGADPLLLEAVAKAGAQMVLMHNRGDGRAEGQRYGDVLATVASELEAAIERAKAHGVTGRIWIDPGIGFAKTAEQSAQLLSRLPELVQRFGSTPVLVGASRKSFLGKLAPDLDGDAPPPSKRLPASLAAAAYAQRHRAAAVRVHDVAATRQALLVDEALTRLGERARD